MTDNELDAFYQELGARIRAARIQANIKQDELSTIIGLTRPSIVNMEQGRQRPSIHNLIEIANVLKVDYVALIPSSLNQNLHLDINNIVDSVNDIDEGIKQAIFNAISLINKQQK